MFSLQFFFAFFHCILVCRAISLSSIFVRSNSGSDPNNTDPQNPHCTDTNLHPADINITLWTGEDGTPAQQCDAGSSYLMSDIYYADSHPFPDLSSDNTTNHVYFEFSRALKPNERLDFPQSGDNFIVNGTKQEWACSNVSRSSFSYLCIGVPVLRRLDLGRPLSGLIC